MQKATVYAEDEPEALQFMWIESEKAGLDLGEPAAREWVRLHWWGLLHSRWLEHLQGKHFWVELDRGDFGLMQRKFKNDALLLDRIVDRLVAGQDNLDAILWAIDWGIPTDRVIAILTALDVNSRRLLHRLDCPDRTEVPLVKVDPAWLTWEGGIVARLAWGIVAEGAFDRLPILGDALEEAGCADQTILDHCRLGGSDIAWSWLVDLILWGD